MTQIVGIVGYPLKHTISPAFQQAALDHYGLDMRYDAWETPPEDLEATVRRLREQGVLGFNVTVPHKERILACLNAITDWASFIGAVNTAVARDGRLIGYNTDTYGFLRALKEDGGFEPRGKSVLVLGAGGSARAVALCLEREGVLSIAIANRTEERAEALARVLQPWVPRAEAIPWEQASLAQAAARADLIVNCTTLGMRHGPAEGQTPLAAGQIPPGCLVYDLVYNPPQTPLLRETARAGARTLGGLPMLVYQGAESFRLWTGKEPPLEVMFRAARAALAA